MDNEREPEISEETLRLVRELGARLDKDAVDPSPWRVADLRYAEPYGRIEAQIASLRRELDEIEPQIRDLEGDEVGAEDQDRLRLLRRRGWELFNELRHLERDAALSTSAFARMAPQSFRRDRFSERLPDYLDAVGERIAYGMPGAFWLHGEDARERERAVDALALRLSEGGRLSWLTAVVKVSASRGQPRVTNQLDVAVRRAWDAWDNTSSPPDPSLLSRAVLREAAYGGHTGVAIILAEFPARSQKAAGFHDWLTSGRALGSIPALLIVSAESPPPADSPFQGVRCETAAVRVGRRVAELRLDRGWNRAELADRAAMPQSMIREIEAGLRERVDRRILRRLAVALEIDVSALALTEDEQTEEET